MGAILRDYRPEDFDAIKRLHEASGLDYRLPNLSSPLFIVTKVWVVDDVVRLFGACYIQAELYLVSDQSGWATPQEKFAAIHELEQAGTHELWLRGIDCCCLWLPPELERFGKRLEQLGFSKDRDGWRTYSKQTS